jgi:hypothetical protein
VSDTRHVLLVKPGDVLLIGNVGGLSDPASLDGLGVALQEMGIRCFVFADDIDLGKVTDALAGR